MHIALFGRDFSPTFQKAIENLFQALKNHGIKLVVYEPFLEKLEEKGYAINGFQAFETGQALSDKKIEIMLSVGGDGTILHAASFAIGRGISILGINTGRLGFLSSVSVDELDKAIESLVAKDYTIDYRTTLKLITNNHLFGEENFALNELTISRRDTSSMIRVEALMNNEYLNTYWSDGLIVSTSTGSTAYSLSCGGPVVYPGSGNFILTTIAPHNLNVRPFIIPSDSELKLRVGGRNESFLVSLDSRTEIIEEGAELLVKKHEHSIQLIRLQGHSYLTTLRGKLNWGLDKRNY